MSTAAPQFPPRALLVYYTVVSLHVLPSVSYDPLFHRVRCFTVMADAALGVLSLCMAVVV